MAEETYNGVRLSNRYDEPGEITAMKDVIDALETPARASIESIWCDSKAQALYTVTVREGAWEDALEADIRAAFGHALTGYNGVYIEGAPRQIAFDPEWPEGPDWD